MPNPRPIYAFGDFRLDAAKRCLSLRVGGTAVALADPVFDTLLHLVERAGEVVDRQALLNAVWPHVTVVENSVSQTVSALRRALGDDRGVPRYVSTVSRRGYRFVAEVTAERTAVRDPRVQQLYASGWSALSRPWENTLVEALGYFQQAVDLDPDFALAHACMAECYILLNGLGFWPGEETMSKAMAAAERAVAADPDLPDAKAVMANLQAIAQGYRASGDSFRQMAEAYPSCFWAQRYLGVYLMHTGDQEAAIAVLRRAQAIEPLAVHNNGNIGMALYFDGRYQEAVDQLETTLRMDPAFGVARMFLGRALLQLGQGDRAMESVIERPAEIAITMALSGRRDAARRALGDLLQTPDVRAFDVASVYAALGDDDEALTWLERAVEESSVGFLGVDPLFRALLSHPRFKALVAKVGV